MPDKSCAYISVHGFWKWGTSALFYMQIVNSHAGSYLSQTSAKSLTTVEEGQRGKYLHTCLEHKCSFTPMVHSVEKIPITKAVAAHQRLYLLLNNKLNWGYLEMYSFVRDRMSLAIVRSNTPLIRDSRDKESYIRQRPNLVDGAVMAVLTPWRV